MLRKWRKGKPCRPPDDITDALATPGAAVLYGQKEREKKGVAERDCKKIVEKQTENKWRRGMSTLHVGP